MAAIRSANKKIIYIKKLLFRSSLLESFQPEAPVIFRWLALIISTVALFDVIWHTCVMHYMFDVTAND